MKLTHESTEALLLRQERGDALLPAVQTMNDRYFAASDVVVDLLTALFGPAGACSDTDVVYDDEALASAQAFLEHVARSYEADAEDYALDGDEPLS